MLHLLVNDHGMQHGQPPHEQASINALQYGVAQGNAPSPQQCMHAAQHRRSVRSDEHRLLMPWIPSQECLFQQQTHIVLTVALNTWPTQTPVSTGPSCEAAAAWTLPRIYRVGGPDQASEWHGQSSGASQAATTPTGAPARDGGNPRARFGALTAELTSLSKPTLLDGA